MSYFRSWRMYFQLSKLLLNCSMELWRLSKGLDAPAGYSTLLIRLNLSSSCPYKAVFLTNNHKTSLKNWEILPGGTVDWPRLVTRMKIFKAFILGAAVECSKLNQERIRRQGDIDWNFINSNSNGNTVGNGEIFRINKYIASVYVSDRYARTELALAVKNNDLVNNQKYNFAVNLKDDEFISGLTMKIGENGTVSTGDVHKENTAVEIFAKEHCFPS